jgi:hypothetical protein
MKKICRMRFWSITLLLFITNKYRLKIRKKLRAASREHLRSEQLHFHTLRILCDSLRPLRYKNVSQSAQSFRKARKEFS